MECGFYLYTSDSIEKLAAQYVAARKVHPELFHGKDLFSLEEIIVPSGGMGKWLERCLADQGIMLSNIRFSSLFALFNRLFRQTGDIFDRDSLLWRIISILRESSSEEFKELSDYIAGGKAEESRDLRRYSLAEKIALLFENYLVESPEMLTCWSKGEFPKGRDFPWQAKLWERLWTGADGEKIVSLADQITALLNGDFSVVSSTLSAPITVWGCSTMPLRQLAVLKRLSEKVPVHCFCMNPCDAFWTDDLRKKWGDGLSIEEPKEVGKIFEDTLLRQWANHEREFFNYLVDIKKFPAKRKTSLQDSEFGKVMQTHPQQVYFRIVLEKRVKMSFWDRMGRFSICRKCFAAETGLFPKQTTH